MRLFKPLCAVMLVAGLAGCSHPPASYADQIAQWHAEKDRFMREAPDSPIPQDKRAGFPPLLYFPTDPSFRTAAVLEPAPTSGPIIEMPTSSGQPRKMQRIGVLKFSLQGHPLALGSFIEAGETDMRRLFVPFGDLTNGIDSYQGGRYLDLDRTPTGLYDLDFNRAYHPFCVYNAAYECPYPPPENRLPLPIRAGEKLPAGKR